MPNIKSAKKRALQTIKRQQRNQARRSSVKTAIKKVVTAIENNEAMENAKKLFIEAESKIASAKGKGLMHRNTAARKISRLAKKLAAVTQVPVAQ
jgi:small subunit ribosomal protein S20